MKRLGILPKTPVIVRDKPAYDRIVMIIFESVHRDYLHYYNPAIPKETTPYLDLLVEKYPHLDHYYSSAVPTTQGLTMRHSAVSSSMMVTCRGPTSRHCFVPLKKRGFRGHFSVHQAATTIMSTASIQNSLVWLTILLRKILPKRGYSGASGWGFHNDVMYDNMLRFLKKSRGQSFLVVTKTLDMHQPYPYYGITYENMPESVRNPRHGNRVRHVLGRSDREAFL